MSTNTELTKKLQQDSVKNINRALILQTENTEKTFVKPILKTGELSKESREYLNKQRGLPDSTIDLFGFQTADKGQLTVPVRDEKGELVLIKYRHATGGKLKFASGKETKTYIEPGGKHLLFGSHLADPKLGPAVIGFGDFEAASFHAAGIPNGMSVSGGDHNDEWLEYQSEFLEEFDEIILFFDNDVIEDSGAEQKNDEWKKDITRRLGMYKVRIAEYADAKDPNELLVKQGAAALKTAAENASFVKIGGLKNLASCWRPLDATGMLMTGIPKLDATTDGLGRGQASVWAADTGSGKSNLMANVVRAAVKDNIKVFFWPGEQPAGDIANWLDLIVAGPDAVERKIKERSGAIEYYVKAKYLKAVRSFYDERVYCFDRESYRDEILKNVKPVDRRKQTFTQKIDNSVCTINNFFDMAETAVKRHGCRLIVLDNLMQLALNSYNGDMREYYQAQIRAVKYAKYFAEEWGVHFAICAHTRKGDGGTNRDDIEGFKQVLSQVDYVFRLKRLDEEEKIEEFTNVDAYIEIQKNRHFGSVKDKIMLNFDRPSKRFYECGYEDLLGESSIILPEDEGIPAAVKPTAAAKSDGLPHYTKMPVAAKPGDKFYLNGDYVEIVDDDTPF